MSVFAAVQRLAEPIGLDVGRSYSRVQADLLNGLAKGIVENGNPTHGDPLDVGMQCAYISDDLSDKAKSFIVKLADYCKENS